MAPLAGWQNFYVIVGSSAGALIGLQFVVLTLIANWPITRDGVAQAGSTFSTPTIVYFGTVLLLSALLSAPWSATTSVATLCALVGLCGILYSLMVTRRLRVQTVYQPVFEDWLFHAFLPLVAYATMALAAYAALTHLREALEAVAVAALLLLFIGIHNAWDAVTYHVFHPSHTPTTPASKADAGEIGTLSAPQSRPPSPGRQSARLTGAWTTFCRIVAASELRRFGSPCQRDFSHRPLLPNSLASD